MLLSWTWIDAFSTELDCSRRMGNAQLTTKWLLGLFRIRNVRVRHFQRTTIASERPHAIFALSFYAATVFGAMTTAHCGWWPLLDLIARTQYTGPSLSQSWQSTVCSCFMLNASAMQHPRMEWKAQLFVFVQVQTSSDRFRDRATSHNLNWMKNVRTKVKFSLRRRI